MQIILDMAENSNKMKIKLPKVLNKAMGWESSAPYQFSSQQWNVGTASYKQSIERRGADFIQAIFVEVHSLQNQKLGIDADLSSGAGHDIDLRACLCMFINCLYLWN